MKDNSLCIEFILAEIIEELFDELVVISCLINQLLMFLEFLRNRFHPFSHLRELLNTVWLIVKLPADRLKLLARL